MLETQTQIYGVVLPVHVAQRARVVAAMNGTSRSGLMRDLLLEYLNGCDNEKIIHPGQPIPSLSERTKTAVKVAV